MSAHHTYWTTIGGNIDDTPMDAERWDTFRDHLRRVVNLWGSPITSISGGVSTWGGETEQTYAVLFTIEPSHLEALRYSLRNLARTYRQEAIGLVGGPGESLVIAPQPPLSDAESAALADRGYSSER